MHTAKHNPSLNQFASGSYFFNQDNVGQKKKFSSSIINSTDESTKNEISAKSFYINDAIIKPKSIVVVGGSNDLSKPGGAVLKNIIEGGYQGKLYVINPREVEVQGVKILTDEYSPPQIDLAIISISVDFIKESVLKLINKFRVKAFIIFSAGFSEMGEKGKLLETEISDLITKNNATLIGPNCIGVLTTHYNGIFAGPIPKISQNGCDLVSSSGATAVFIIEQGIASGLTFSSLFSVGNSAQIGVEEILQYWDMTFDPIESSKIKLIYMENIKNPGLFLKHATSLIKKGCSIAAIKAGVSDAGKRAALSHTGALANPNMAVDAIFKKAGVVRCAGREDLVATATIFSQGNLQGNNIAIITHAGGPGVMLIDALSKANINVPSLKGPVAEELLSKLYPGSSTENPIDYLATGTAEHLSTIIDYIDKCFPEIDAISLIFGETKLADVKSVYKLIYEKIQTISKPIYPILTSIGTGAENIEYFKSLGGRCFSDEVTFGKALGNIIKLRKTFCDEDELVNLKIDNNKIRSIIQQTENGYLSPTDIRALLDAVGIPQVEEVLFSYRDELLSKAKDLQYPITMKVVGPLHKSDIGGVVLNIENASDAIVEFDRLMQIPTTNAVLIQPMLQGIELFAGVKYEPGYGHLIVCGLGGIFIEVLKDIAVELSPVSNNEAKAMIKALKSYPIIAGTRGQEGIHQKGFVDIIRKLSALVQIAPEITELDLNPIFGTADKVTVADARIKINHIFDEANISSSRLGSIC